MASWFLSRLQEVLPYACEMVDGVMGVFTNASRQERLYEPPGTADQFFTDMHW